jgi:TRAP-type mannitol/chloroaromatic compound transport system permease large subunit
VEQLDDLQRKGKYIVPPKVVRIVSANNLGCSVNNLQTVIPF